MSVTITGAGGSGNRRFNVVLLLKVTFNKIFHSRLTVTYICYAVSSRVHPQIHSRQANLKTVTWLAVLATKQLPEANLQSGHTG
jgi:hypothetical protein